MPIKPKRMRAMQKRYGKRRGRKIYFATEKHPKAYQVMVKEGKDAIRPLSGMRIFSTKREAEKALRLLAPYEDQHTKISLRTTRRS